MDRALDTFGGTFCYHVLYKSNYCVDGGSNYLKHWYQCNELYSSDGQVLEGTVCSCHFFPFHGKGNMFVNVAQQL
jgi:hypothetical protein